MIEPAAILGVILAGGLGRRLGGDKPWRALAGRPLIVHVAERIAPQVGRLIVSAPAADPRFADLGLACLPDVVPGLGPLGGIMTALADCQTLLTGCRAVLAVPVDCPFLPDDLVARLTAAAVAAGAKLACAASAGRVHPTVSVWSRDLAARLRALVADERIRAAGAAAERLGAISVAFSDKPCDPFFNVNRPEDLAAAEILRKTLTQRAF